MYQREKEKNQVEKKLKKLKKILDKLLFLWYNIDVPKREVQKIKRL